MTAYLIANKPRQTQYRERRAKPTGCIVLHTAESAPDTVGPDTGTMNVANFIRNRSDYGSYHKLADSDSRLQLIPWWLAAYGDGTGSNEFAIHISGATQAARWNGLPKAWRDGCLKEMARSAAEAAKWLKATHGIVVPARRITKAQSDAGMAGFIPHGDRDPGRRYDPGFDADEWETFFGYYKLEMDPTIDDFDEVVHMHVSMQFSDDEKQVTHDAKRIFGHKSAPHFITGTEAGGKTGPMIQEVLKREAKANGYLFFVERSVWIAVARSVADSGYKTGYKPVLDASDGEGKHTDRGVVWIQFNNRNLGTVAVLASHYLTKGRPGTGELSVNLDENKKLAEAIGDVTRKLGRGKAIVFYGGDQNIPDSKFDTFLGQPLTSAGDELNKHPNTGHGPIDVSASYDEDGRVVATDWNVLDDKELFLHTDHFMCIARYHVTWIKR